ncbi:MAG: hypothetical protein EGQ81_01295 [Akkermansia sp.]|nr:hypothetical protein [Akkermansia sp.]
MKINGAEMRRKGVKNRKTEAWTAMNKAGPCFPHAFSQERKRAGASCTRPERRLAKSMKLSAYKYRTGNPVPAEGIWTNLLPLRFLLFQVPEQFKSRMPFLWWRNGIPIKRL